VVQLEKYFDFSLYSHHFSLLSLTSLLSAPEREVTFPSDFKVVGALYPCLRLNTPVSKDTKGVIGSYSFEEGQTILWSEEKGPKNQTNNGRQNITRFVKLKSEQHEPN
jgi:hypothetical protein